MKKLLVLFVTVFLFSLSAQNIVLADDAKDDDCDGVNCESSSDDMNEQEDVMNGDSEKKETKRIAPRPTLYQEKTNLKEMKNMNKEELKKMKDEARTSIEENRNSVKENIKTFQGDNKDEFKNIRAELTDKQKATLTELSKMFQNDMDTLKAELKDASTQEARDAINIKIQELVDTHYIAMKDVLGDNLNAIALLDERHTVYQENEALREENRSTREEYKTERKAIVDKYRTSFIARLGSALDKISNEKLEKLVTRIDTMLATYEANTVITADRKDKILGQLIALKELIEEHLDTQDVEADVLDIISELTAQ